jgi:hypothetical protein
MIAGYSLYLGSIWLFLAAVTQLHGLAAAGAVGIAQSLTAPLFRLSNLGLRPIVALESRAPIAVTFVLARLICTCLAVLVYIAALDYTVDDLTVYAIAVVFGLLMAIDSLYDMVYAFYQRRGLAINQALSLVVRAAVLVVFIGAYYQGTLSWRIACCLAAIALLIHWALDLRYASAPFGRSIDELRLSDALAASKWVMISGFVGASAVAVVRLIVDHYGGAVAVGEITILMAFPLLYAAIAGLVAQSDASRLRQAAQDSAGRRLAFILVRQNVVVIGVAAPAIFAFALYGDEVASSIFGTEASALGGRLLYSMLFMYPIVVAQTLALGLMAVGGYRASMTMNLLALLLVIIAGLTLVPLDFYYGSMASLSIMGLFQCSYMASVIARWHAVERATRRGVSPRDRHSSN